MTRSSFKSQRKPATAVKSLHYTRGTNERPMVWSCGCGAPALRPVGWAICLVKTRLSAVHNRCHQSRMTSGINLSSPTADCERSHWPAPAASAASLLLLWPNISGSFTVSVLGLKILLELFSPPDRTDRCILSVLRRQISFHYCFSCHHCSSDFNSFESCSP